MLNYNLNVFSKTFLLSNFFLIEFNSILKFQDATLLPIVHELNGTAANITGFKLTTNNDNKYTQVNNY